MATLETEALDAAFDDGLFKRRLTDNQRKYLRQSILTMSSLLETIDDRIDNGIDSEALAEALGFNRNTIKIYCLWLVKKGLIESVVNEIGTEFCQITYFSLRSRLTRVKRK